MKTPPLHLLVIGTILVLLMYLLLSEWFSEPQREHLAAPAKKTTPPPTPVKKTTPPPTPTKTTPVAYHTLIKPPKKLMRWLNRSGEWILYWEPPDVVRKYGFTIDTSDGYKYQVPERTGSFHYYNLGQHTMGGVSFVLRMTYQGVVKSTLGFPVPTTLAAGDAKIKSWRAIRISSPESPPPTLLYASVAPKVVAKGGAHGSSTHHTAGNSEVLFWDNFSKRLLRVLDRWSHGGSYDQVPTNTMPFRHPPQPVNPKPISNVSR
jgi:hypothetical protein